MAGAHHERATACAAVDFATGRQDAASRCHGRCPLMSAEPPALSWPSPPAVKTPLPLPWPVPTMSAEPPALSWPSPPAVKTPAAAAMAGAHDECGTAGAVLAFATGRQDAAAAAVAGAYDERATAGVVLAFATSRQDAGATAVAASPHCERATACAAVDFATGRQDAAAAAMAGAHR